MKISGIGAALVLAGWAGLATAAEHAAGEPAAEAAEAADTMGEATTEPGLADTLTADLAAGEEAYQAVCRNCHGPKAQGIASYPRLSDKEIDYIVDRLVRYRDGEKIGPNSMLMIPHAQDLTDQEIVDLAGYVTTAFD